MRMATVRRAWDLGIRYFDTAPLYGYGAVGAAVRAGARATEPRDAFVLSTKVGRLVRPPDAIPPGADIDRQALRRPRRRLLRRRPAGRGSCSTTRADGVRRSIEESLERLGLDRIDIALIHDPDDHWQAAIDGAYPALARLRERGRDPGRSAPA